MKSRIFYALGTPICIMQQKDLYAYPRKYIPDNELIESFSEKNLQTIKLFKTENDAFKYCTRRNRPRRSPQFNSISAIFKVEYSGSNENWEKEDIEYVAKEYGTIVSFKNDGIDILTLFQIEYVEVDRREVIPLEAKLKLRDESRENPNGTTILAKLDYLSLNNNNEQSYFRGTCTLI